HEDQPEWPFVTWLAVGPVFNHTIEQESLSRPLSHSEIVPSTDLDPPTAWKLALFSLVDRRQRPSVIQFDLAPSHWWPPDSPIWGRRQEETTMGGDTAQNRHASLMDRSEKRLDRVTCIDIQNLITGPAVPLDELFDLDHTIGGRMNTGRNPGDLRRQHPTALAGVLAQQRQTVSQAHP